MFRVISSWAVAFIGVILLMSGMSADDHYMAVVKDVGRSLAGPPPTLMFMTFQIVLGAALIMLAVWGFHQGQPKTLRRPFTR